MVVRDTARGTGEALRLRREPLVARAASSADDLGGGARGRRRRPRSGSGIWIHYLPIRLNTRAALGGQFDALPTPHLVALENPLHALHNNVFHAFVLQVQRSCDHARQQTTHLIP